MLAVQQELDILSELQEIRFFSDQKSYAYAIKELNSELESFRVKIAEIFSFTLMFPFLHQIVYLEMDLLSATLVAGLSACIVWPIAEKLSRRNVNENFARIFFGKRLAKINELKNLVKQEEEKFKNSLNSPKTKAFFSKLYLFMESQAKLSNSLIVSNVLSQLNDMILAYSNSSDEEKIKIFLQSAEEIEENIKKILDESMTKKEFLLTNHQYDLETVEKWYKKQGSHKYEI